MGRELTCYLLDCIGEKIEIVEDEGCSKKLLRDIDEICHCGNVYNLYKFYQMNSLEEHIFSLEEIRKFINEAAKNFSFTKLLTNHIYRNYEDENVLNEIQLLSYICEEADYVNEILKISDNKIVYVQFIYY